MEKKLETLTKIYDAARTAGMCHNQGEFAELLGIHPSTISAALKGNEKYLTDNFLRRVQLWARQAGLEGQPAPVRPAEPDIVIPAATAAMYTNMTETIRIQAEIIARLQSVPASPYTGMYAPKNLRTDK